MTNASITLFLDFDGCTHSEPATHYGVFSCMTRIEAVLREHVNVEIVISSSWRELFSLDELQDNFARDIFQRVIDVTPVIRRRPPPSVRHVRQAEIEMWLRANRSLNQPWIAIDDSAEWFQADCRHLLLCDRRTGFTDADALLLHKMIKERL